jgi:hypothetical protein
LPCHLSFDPSIDLFVAYALAGNRSDQQEDYGQAQPKVPSDITQVVHQAHD